ncbi:ferritin-like domain-containing protein [Natrinema sp. 74]|uniref:YciE/YciF ferroxidase family protein n=1 Tax=Natrinema sp. 74 TaxID=3384159 RepID=UPI0038D4B81E
MARYTINDRMSEGFADHRDETRTQIQRLKDVFAALDQPAEGQRSLTPAGLENNRRELEAQIVDDDLLNAASLNPGLMTERVEMTAYEGLTTIAALVDLGGDVQHPLDSTYDEAKSRFRDLELLWDRLSPS